jgi:hypothetical protein
MKRGTHADGTSITDGVFVSLLNNLVMAMNVERELQFGKLRQKQPKFIDPWIFALIIDT